MHDEFLNFVKDYADFHGEVIYGHILFLRMNTSDHSSASASLLKQIAQLGPMEKGTLSVIRETTGGPCCNFQRWEAGGNRSEYVSAGQVPKVREHLESYRQFESLVSQYVQVVSEESRRQRLEESKKKTSTPPSTTSRPRRSSSPRKPKSKS